jgi:hypothetical protein
MGKTLAQLVAVVRQKTNTDGVAGGNQVVTDPELAGYINEAIRALYDLIVSVDSSYYQASYDFTLTGAATGNVAALPADFYKERGLVIFPDTERETPVFFKPFAERLRGQLGATLDGNSVRVFPWQMAGQGPWRLYYTPKAPTFEADFSVRVARGRDLPDCITAGVGPLRTIQATANGALPVQDGVALALNDRLLILETDSQGNLNPPDFGIYFVQSLGSGASKWMIKRAPDYDVASATEVRTGIIVTATEGTANAGIPYKLGTFVGPVDTGAQSYTVATLDVTMDNFDEYVTSKAALAVFAKRQMDPGIQPALFSAAEARVNAMASMRLAEPEQAPIMWRGRTRRSWYDDDPS